MSAQAIRIITSPAYDFTATYMALSSLRDTAGSRPQTLDPMVVPAVVRLLMADPYAGQRQALFLYRQAAKILVHLMCRAGSDLSASARKALGDLLRSTGGPAHRAVAEAVGSVPLKVRGPRITLCADGAVATRSWRQLLQKHRLGPSGEWKFVGRSLVFTPDAAKGKKILVLKLARRWGHLEDLEREIAWMAHMGSHRYRFQHRFEIPRAITWHGRGLFRLEALPIAPPAQSDLHWRRYAVGFIAKTDYFRYPNGPDKNSRPAPAAFREILERNAWLLGHLASQGIIHTAPIPLFHNRVQRERRRDGGCYEWFRAGRLDRWLASCAYPNLGASGLRDFEHLTTFEGPSIDMYRHLGTHFLSLLLIAASYFRNAAPQRMGWDSQGRPLDMRDLFDAKLLNALIPALFRRYYHGFVRHAFRGSLPFDAAHLTKRIIAEMGVDRHMIEILRIADQNNMSPKVFRRFLQKRGFNAAAMAKIQQGSREIEFLSGPHLGAFNRPISLPELIEAVESMSALCMLGRYETHRRPSVHKAVEEVQLPDDHRGKDPASIGEDPGGKAGGLADEHLAEEHQHKHRQAGE